MRKVVVPVIIFTLGVISYPIAKLVLESAINDDEILLSGSDANFFKEYVIPLPEDQSVSTGYDVFYGYSDNSKIELEVKIKSITHNESNLSKIITKSQPLMKKDLHDKYCHRKEKGPAIPALPSYPFIKANEDNKKIIIRYYDMTGQSLLFGVGISPVNCQ